MASEPLDVYLNDHRAGATFGSNLASQLVEFTAGTAFGEVMQSLADEIEEDRETLSGLMERAGITENPVKTATTWLAEKANRVRLSGLSAREHEFAVFMALETLSLGVEGKASLWRALERVQGRYPALAAVDFGALGERAGRQREALENERVAAARRSFTGELTG